MCTKLVIKHTVNSAADITVIVNADKHIVSRPI